VIPANDTLVADKRSNVHTSSYVCKVVRNVTNTFFNGIFGFPMIKIKIEIMRKCLFYLIRKLLKCISSPLLLLAAAIFFKLLKSSMLSDLSMSNLEIWHHR